MRVFEGVLHGVPGQGGALHAGRKLIDAGEYGHLAHAHGVIWIWIVAWAGDHLMKHFE